MKKCLSIDWLQLYCDCSGIVFDRDYTWNLQKYQTKQFRKVYEVIYRSEEIATVVMEPTSSILPRFAGLVKFKNRQLYGQNLQSMVISFLDHNNLVFKSITRIDLALDFNYFFNSLDPHTFIHRFLRCDYLKIGRGKFTCIGEQKFQNEYQYLKFGSKTSEVNVYMYDKSTELKQVQDKPYIRKKWSITGLDFTKKIWRLEISIKSKGTHYINLTTGEEERILLDQLNNGSYLSNVYYSYMHQYFRFCINDGSTNKYRMQELRLFDQYEPIYKPLYLPETTGANKTDKVFLKKLYALDQEIRGFNDDSLSAQKVVLMDFIEATGLQDYFIKHKDDWNKSAHRPE